MQRICNNLICQDNDSYYFTLHIMSLAAVYIIAKNIKDFPRPPKFSTWHCHLLEISLCSPIKYVKLGQLGMTLVLFLTTEETKTNFKLLHLIRYKQCLERDRRVYFYVEMPESGAYIKIRLQTSYINNGH